MRHVYPVAAVLLASIFPWIGAASRQSPASQQPQQPPAQQTAPQQPATPQQGGRIPVEVRLVNVVYSVTDRHRHFVTDLDKSDFKVLEDGQPQEITFFSRETDMPLRVGLLLDTSNSIRQRFQFEKEAANDFLYNVIRREKDMAFLMTFDNQPEIEQDYTDDIELLRIAIDRQRAGGGTALRDAIYQACHERLMSPPPVGQNQTLRRILVVISDGEDNLSDHTRTEAIDMAQRAGVAIYAISTSTDWVSPDQKGEQGMPLKLHHTAGDDALEQLADETGGRAFFPYRADDLSQSFQDIGTELRRQYSLAFAPKSRIADGKFHKIKIEVVGRKGLQVRARKGYYALPGMAAPAKQTGPATQ